MRRSGNSRHALVRRLRKTARTQIAAIVQVVTSFPAVAGFVHVGRHDRSRRSALPGFSWVASGPASESTLVTGLLNVDPPATGQPTVVFSAADCKALGWSCAAPAKAGLVSTQATWSGVPGALPSPIDAVRFRPIGFPQRPVRGVMTLDQLETADSLEALRGRACRARRVVVRPIALESADAVDALLSLAASGAPVEIDAIPVAAAAVLGPDLVHQLTSPAHDDVVERERRSVAIRRAALLHHDLHRRVEQIARELGLTPPPGPSCSVVLASRRPDALLAAVEQVEQQHFRAIEVVLGLHGPGFDDGTESRVTERCSGPVTVMRFDEDVPLGTMLTELTSRSEGRVVVKWDDDDWYGQHHLTDLVLAYRYSGADIVGKAAEFVYLEGRDRTIRRFATGSESYSSLIAGGTMLVSRDLVHEVGGWPRVRRSVDQEFIRTAIDAGGAVYRTHGFGYLLHRRPSGSGGEHTWAADDTYFLADADEHRRGLQIGWAGVEPRCGNGLAR